MKALKTIIYIVLLISAFSCIEETIQLKDLPETEGTYHKIPLPLLNSSLTFEQIAGHAYDSLMVYMGDTILLYLNNDIIFDDTLKINSLGENVDFDFIEVHYRIVNMFPVGLDFIFFLYDSLSQQILDTVYLSDNQNVLLIPAAPANEMELTIESEIDTITSYSLLDNSTVDKLFNQATHMIIYAQIPPTGGFIRILSHYRLDLDLGIYAQGRFNIGLFE